MVNYCYDLDEIERNHESLRRDRGEVRKLAAPNSRSPRIRKDGA